MEIFESTQPSVMILDADPERVACLETVLNKDYRVRAVISGQAALEACTEEPPDLFLIDSALTNDVGVDICKVLKSNATTSQVPMIVIGREGDIQHQKIMHRLGAVDVITYPIYSLTLLSRINAHLAAVKQDRLESVHCEFMGYEASKHKCEVNTLQEITLLTLASLAETRDIETGNHLKRTQNYVYALAQHMKHHPRYSHYLNQERIDLMFKCAPLHDIGKVGIADKILLKPGRYLPEEFEVMKGHPKLGHDAILNAQELVGDNSEFLSIAKEIVYCHHEKWDGSGYPQGLAGDAIPIPARFMAIADVYDALISRRVYKTGMTHEEATQIIVAGQGKHFDPDLVDAFIELSDIFVAIAARFADSDQDIQKKEQMVAATIFGERM